MKDTLHQFSHLPLFLITLWPLDWYCKVSLWIQTRVLGELAFRWGDQCPVKLGQVVMPAWVTLSLSTLPGSRCGRVMDINERHSLFTGQSWIWIWFAALSFNISIGIITLMVSSYPFEEMWRKWTLVSSYPFEGDVALMTSVTAIGTHWEGRCSKITNRVATCAPERGVNCYHLGSTSIPPGYQGHVVP